MTRTRFAPSPTGNLHLGNLRTALLCFLLARKAGGEFVLRLDDTDLARSTAAFADGIIADLGWLGIVPDVIVRQSERFDKYDAAIVKLKADGRLYPCFETKEELEFKRKVQMGRGQPPIYDRAALKISSDERVKFEADGRVPHWRFELNQDAVVEWWDEVRGPQRFEMRHMSDPILVRENGVYTYMLPSTVDDIEMKISHVLRGEDHVSNTAVQIQIFEALGGELPKFGHSALIKNKAGKLSKREGSSGVAELREAGIEPLALMSFLAKLGTSDNVELAADVEELIAGFDLGKFGKSQTMYSMDELERLNAKLMHVLPFEGVQAELVELGLAHVTEGFWLAVRANLTDLKDAGEWWSICHDDGRSVIDAEDAEFVAVAAGLLPEGAIDGDTWGVWLAAIKAATERKGKGLFMPLRKALTGMEHGPELRDLLPLIGRETVLARMG